MQNNNKENQITDQENKQVPTTNPVQTQSAVNQTPYPVSTNQPSIPEAATSQGAQRVMQPFDNPPEKKKFYKNKAILVAYAITAIVLMFLAAYFLFIKTNETQDKTENTNSSVNTSTSGDVAADTQNYLTIKQWGIKIPVDSSTKGLSYTLTSLGGKTNNKGTFTSKALEDSSDYENCKDNNIDVIRGMANDPTYSEIGPSISFKESYDLSQSDPSNNTMPVNAIVGSYYYQTPGWAGASCAGSTAAKQNAETKAISAINKALNKMVASDSSN